MCLNALFPVGGIVWESQRLFRKWNRVKGSVVVLVRVTIVVMIYCEQKQLKKERVYIS